MSKNPTFTDRAGETFEADLNTLHSDSVIELKSDHGQSVVFFTEDAAAIIRLIKDVAKDGVPE